MPIISAASLAIHYALLTLTTMHRSLSQSTNDTSDYPAMQSYYQSELLEREAPISSPISLLPILLRAIKDIIATRPLDWFDATENAFVQLVPLCHFVYSADFSGSIFWLALRIGILISDWLLRTSTKVLPDLARALAFERPLTFPVEDNVIKYGRNDGLHQHLNPISSPAEHLKVLILLGAQVTNLVYSQNSSSTTRSYPQKDIPMVNHTYAI